jgi:endonuclease-8
MPEGDAIFRTARTLHRALAGRTITRFESLLPQLTRVDHDRALAGRTVERVWAAGKHVLMEFSGGLVLRTHMRMNGTWHVYRPGERWARARRHMRVVIENDAFVAVAFNVSVAEFSRSERNTPLALLGPDLLGETLDVDGLVDRLHAEGHRQIAEVLVDQTVAAGIGNVYKSEVCFLCRINPFTSVSALSDDQIRTLVSTARRLLQANVHADAVGQIVTRRTLRASMGRASADERVWVYGRAGNPCYRCGAKIQRDHRGEYGRLTYWCPRCTPSPTHANSSSDG